MLIQKNKEYRCVVQVKAMNSIQIFNRSPSIKIDVQKVTR